MSGCPLAAAGWVGVGPFGSPAMDPLRGSWPGGAAATGGRLSDPLPGWAATATSTDPLLPAGPAAVPTPSGVGVGVGTAAAAITPDAAALLVPLFIPDEAAPPIPAIALVMPLPTLLGVAGGLSLSTSGSLGHALALLDGTPPTPPPA